MSRPWLIAVVCVAFCALLAASSNAQTVGAIAGQVVDDATGMPIPYIQVYVVGEDVGAVTDERGRFRIPEAQAGARLLRAEGLGYTASEAPVTVVAGGTAEIAIALRPEPLRLDEIVATGTAAGALGRQIPHSVGRIDVSRIDEPVATVDELLAGRLPGVTVQQSSGNAGSGSQIRLRGNVSAALSNEPLVYVDGVRIRSDGYPENLPKVENNDGPNDTPSPLNDINPADIDRIEIVKGPAATTLYGAEAASGVVQIFTRRGRSGPPVWTAEVGQGFDRVLDFGTSDRPFVGMEPWLDGAAWRQRYGVSVAGGGPVGYFVSTSLDRNDGVLPDNRDDRWTVRANLDVQPREDLSVRLSTAHTAHDLQNIAGGLDSNSLTLNVFRGRTNALGDTTRQGLEQLLDYDIETGLDHTILGLTAIHAPSSSWMNRVTLGYDRAASAMRQLRPVGFVFAPDGILAEEDWVNGILTAEYVGSIDLTLPRRTSTTLSWGAQSVTSTVESDAGYAEGFDAEEEPTIEGGELSLDFHSKVRTRTSGVFGEMLAGWRDRYYVTGGLRLDGSTAFGDDLGLQAYPRIGGSYIVSEEDFWRDGWGDLKLRTSYGHAGRAPGVIDELRSWMMTSFDGEEAVVPGTIGNPDLGPERTAELEIGFEGSFLNDRLVAEFSYYRQRTTDALFPITPIPSRGFLETQLRNVGTLRNDGIELTLAGSVVSGASFGWDAGFYLHTNDSKLTDLGGAPPLRVFDAGWILEDAPVPTLIAPRILNPDAIAEPIIEEDHVWGATIPTTVLGVSSTIRLPKGIEIDARGEYMGGHYVFDNVGNNLARREVYPPCDPAYALREAGRDDELTAWQRVWCIADNVPDDGGPIYPGDFFRFRELTLRAPLPGTVLGDWRATVVASAQNFWAWKNDDFLLFDPEMVGDDGMQTIVRRIDSQVPSPSRFVVSVRVTR
ncbi:MAG TPA: TonB-dependent receptor [Gemmatimonadota bacterium]|nr:TonB-dependent receptor [Gemmatimonadota bacterium]